MKTEREQIVDLAKSLVEIPSAIGNCKDALRVLKTVNNFFESELKQGKIVTKEFINEKVVSQIWGDPNHLMDPQLLLSGHIDVLDKDQDNQFSPFEKDGKLFGRGTTDMKGPVASMLVAYKKWLQEEGPKGVSLVLTSDEETGGFKGTNYLVREKGLKPSVIFIPDGGQTEFEIIDSQKAPHHFRVISEEKGGHASRAFEFKNPINNLINAYLEVQAKFDLAKSTKNKDHWASSFEMTTIQSPIIDIFNPETGSRIENHTEANGLKVGKLYQTKEGRKIFQDLVTAKFQSANKIQSTAEAWFCWRWPLEQIPFEKGMSEIREIFVKHGCKFTGDEHGGGESCLIDDKTAPYVQKWKIIIEDILDKEVNFGKMHGATDGRHFYTAGHKQVLVTSVVGKNAHGKDEYVDIDSLVKLSSAVYRYQKEIVG